jgi:hypothetical protein
VEVAELHWILLYAQKFFADSQMLRLSLSAGWLGACSFLLISAIFSRSCAIFPSFWFWLSICASFCKVLSSPFCFRNELTPNTNPATASISSLTKM